MNGVEVLKDVNSILQESKKTTLRYMKNERDYLMFQYLQGRLDFINSLTIAIDKKIIDILEGSAKLTKPDQITETDRKESV